MADGAQAISEKAGSRHSKSKSQGREQLCKFHTLDELLTHIDSLKSSYLNRRSSKAFDRLEPSLVRLWEFNTCVQSYLQASPKPFILLWGSLSIVLQLSLKYARGLKSFSDCLEEIADALPRINLSCYQLAPTSSDILHDTLLQYREELLSFCQEAEFFFTRRFSRNFLRSASLKADQCARIGRLRSLRVRFDQEANVTYLSRILKGLPPIGPERSTTSDMLLGNVPFNNLPCRNHFFYGRRAQLTEVDLLLKSSAGFRQDQVACYGLPGSGKSELALEYAHQKFEAASYEVVLWVCADTEVKLAESIGSITRGLGLLSDGYNHGAESQQDVLLRWLEKTARRTVSGKRHIEWLIVFDNVSDRSILDEYWRVASKGSAIVTCRSPEIASLYAKTKLEVDCLGPQEGPEFLLSLCRRNPYWDEREFGLATAVSRVVGNHPLTLNMIGCHLRQCGKSLEHFLRDNPTFERDLVIRQDPLVRPENAHERSVSDIFALNAKGTTSLDGPPRLLVNMLAFLDPDGVPLDLFTSHSRDAMLSEGPDDVENFVNLNMILENPFEDSIVFDHSRSILLDLALIKMDGSNNKIKCHRLVQLAAEWSMSSEQKSTILNKLVFFLNAAFPAQVDGQPLLSQWPKCDEFAASVVSVLESCIKNLDHIRQPALLAEVACRCAWYYYEKGWFDTARRMTDQVIEFCEQLLATGNHAGYTRWYVIDMISHHFNTKGAIGMKIPEADHGLEMYQTSLNIRVGNLREGNQEDQMWIGAAMGNLAISLMATGEAEQALPKLLELVQREDMKTNEDLYLSNLCLCFYLLFRLEEALVTSEAAVECIKRRWGSNDVRIATVMFYVSNIRERMGDIDGAQEAIAICMDIRQQNMPLHPETGLTYHRMGVLFRRNGDTERACEHLAKALDVFSSCEVHPGAVCRTALELGAVAQKAGHLQVSEACDRLASQYKRSINGFGMCSLGDSPSEYDRFITVGLR